MNSRVRLNCIGWMALACLVLISSQETQGKLVQFSDVPLVDFVSKLDFSHIFQWGKTNSLLDWIKWILNVASGFLDPMYIGHMQMNAEEKDFTVHLTGDAMTIRHLRSAKISNVTAENNTLGVSANVSFPKLGLQGVYNLTGRVNELEMDLFGRGFFRVKLNDFTLYGALRLSVGVGSKLAALRLEDLDFSIKSLDFMMDNLMGGGAVSDLINGVVSEVGQIAAYELKPNITRIVMDVVNKALSNYTPQK